MYNSHPEINNRTKKSRKVLKPIVFIGLLVILTLLFTMYQASIRPIESSFLSALFDNATDYQSGLPTTDCAYAKGSRNGTLINRTITIDGSSSYNIDMSANVDHLLQTWCTDKEHPRLGCTYTSSKWQFGNKSLHSTSGCASSAANFDLGERVGLLAARGVASLYFKGSGYKGGSLDNYTFNITSSSSAFGLSIGASSNALHEESRDGTEKNGYLFNGEYGGRHDYEGSRSLRGRYVRVILSSYDKNGYWDSCGIDVYKFELRISDDTMPTIAGTSSNGQSKWGTSNKITVKDTQSGLYNLSCSYNGENYSVGSFTKGQTSEHSFTLNKYGKYVITAEDTAGKKNVLTYHYYNPQVEVRASDSNGGTVYLDNSTTLSKRYAHGDTYTIKAVPKNGYYFAGWKGSDLVNGTNYKPNDNSVSDLSFSKLLTIGDPSDYTKNIVWTAQFKPIETDTGSYWNSADLKAGKTESKPYNGTEYKLKCKKPTGVISEDAEYTAQIEDNASMRYAGEYSLYVQIKCGSTTVGKSATLKLTITKVSIKFKPKFKDGGSKVYDGNSTAEFVGWEIAEGKSYDGTLNVGGTPRCKYMDGNSEAVNVGTWTIRATGKPTINGDTALVNSYTVTNKDTFDVASCKITPKPISFKNGVIAVIKASKVYDGTLDHTIDSYGVVEGAINGEVISVSDSYATAKFRDKNVGEGKPVDVAGIKLTCTKKISNYSYNGNQLTDGGIGTVELTANITKKSIDAVASAQDKVYDGLTAITATVEAGGDLLTGDELSLSYTGASFDTASVGTGKTVTVNGITISGGADKNNYSLNSNTVTTNASVTRRTVNLKVDDKSKTFGHAEPTFTYNYDKNELPEVDREKSKDELFGYMPIGREKGEDAGSYKIYFTAQANGETISNGATTDYGNYHIVMGTATMTIRKLTVKVNIREGITKIYGQTVDLGAVNKTDLKFTPVKADGETFRDGYIFVEPQNNTYPVLTIDQKPCVGTHLPRVAPEYADKMSDMHANYKYVIAEGEELNRVTITAKTVTAKYDGEAIYYGVTPVLNVSYEGFVWEENQSDIFLTLPSVAVESAVTINEFNRIDVGTYELAPDGGVVKSNAQGNKNYVVKYENGTLRIRKKELKASLDIEGSGFTRVERDGIVSYVRPYDGKVPALVVKYEGFAPGEGDDVLTVKATASHTNTSIALKNAGTYTISVTSGEAKNYDVKVGNNVNVSITKVGLTVTYIGEEITYGNDPKSDDSIFSYEGFVTVDGEAETNQNLTKKPSITFLTAANRAPSGKIKVGEYACTPEGAQAVNYILTYVAGTLIVNKKDLIVTYKGNSLEYGIEPESNITFDYEGFVSGDNFANALSAVSVVEGGMPRNAGTYDLGSETFAFESNNYNVRINSGTLEIKKALLTVTAQNQSFEYGEVKADFVPILLYAGFKYADTADDIDTKPTVVLPDPNVNGYVDAGTYTLSPDGWEDNNYVLDCQEGRLTVNKKLLTVTYLGECFTYSGSAPQPNIENVKYEGFVDGEDEKSLDASVFTPAVMQRNTSVNVCGYEGDGSLMGYWLMPGRATAQNYTFNYEEGCLYILPATITVAYLGESVVYGTAPELTITYTGWLSDLDDETQETMVTTPSELTFDGGAVPADVGVYDLALTTAVCKSSQTGVPNYVFEYVNGTLTIRQKELTVKFIDETLGYGEVYQKDGVLVFPWVAEYQGFIDGEDEAVLKNKPVVTAPSSFGQGEYIVTPVCVDGLTAETSERNYYYVFVGGTLTITAKRITVTYTSDVAKYGEINGNYDFYSRLVYTGVAYAMGDTDEGVLDKSGVTLSGVPSANDRNYIDAGSYNIVPSGLVTKSANYYVDEDSYVGGSLTINKVAVTFYLHNKDVFYNEIPTTQEGCSFEYVNVKDEPQTATEDATVFVLVYNGFVRGEDYSVLSVIPGIDVLALPKDDDGFYTVAPVMPGGVDPSTADRNYVIVLEAKEQNYNIFRARFDMTNVVFEEATFDYDGEEHSIFVTDGIPETGIEGQNIVAHYIGNDMRDAGTYNVNVYFTHNIAGYSRIKETFSATLTINKRAIEFTVEKDLLTEVYGNADKEIEGTASYVATGDEQSDLNVRLSLPEYDTAYRVCGGYAISATYDNANYEITFKVSDGTLLEDNRYSVTKREVEVAICGQTAVYNGDVAPVVDNEAYEVTSELGFMDGDDRMVTISVESADKYTVGTYALDGVSANTNYSVSFTSANFTVTRATATLTLFEQSKVYDGNEATLDNSDKAYSFGEGEIKSGDTLIPEIYYVNDGEHVHASSYPITATLVNENYQITVVDSSMIIVKRNATVTLRPQEAVYGDTYTLDFTAYDVENVVDGDDLGITMTRKGGGLVGEYDIYATASNPDYVVTVVNSVFSIKKRQAKLNVELFDNVEYVYVPGGVYVRPDAERYVTHDNGDLSDYSVGIVYPEEPLTNAGVYTVTVSVPETRNYLGASEQIIVTVKKAVTKIDTSIMENTEYVYTGTEQSIVGATSNNTDASATLEYLNNKFTNVPESGAINVSVRSVETDNYTEAYVVVSVKIRRAALNFSEYELRSENVTYNGEYRTVEAKGVPSNVTVTYLYNEEESSVPYSFRESGTYRVRVKFEYDSVNYQAPKVGTEAVLNIYRASITLKAKDLVGQYGDEVVFTDEDYDIVSGVVYDGDELGVKITTAKEIRDIGSYTLSATASNPNYDITVGEGTYTIIERKITVKFDDVEVVYGSPEVPITFTITEGSLLEGDTLIQNANREPGKAVGSYAISGVVVNPLYDITVEKGSYNIIKRSITIKVDSQTGTSENDIKDDRFTVDGGIVQGDSLDIAVVCYDIGKEPGAYTLTASYDGTNENYDITVINGTFNLVRLAVIEVGSYEYRKIYDGKPLSADVKINSGAKLVFTVRNKNVENSFTEVGVYNVTVSAEAVDGYSAPKSVEFTIEICPTRLTTEVDGIIFVIENPEGFSANDLLKVERNENSALDNSEFMQQLDVAYLFTIEHDGIDYTVSEYFNGSDVAIKIKPTDELKGTKNFASFITDANGEKLTDGSVEMDEEGFFTLNASNGMQVYFVSDRPNAIPIIVAVSVLVVMATFIIIFLIFRRKA